VLDCQRADCGKAMVGPVRVKASEVHIPHLPDVNNAYWTFKWQEHELEGLGYVCPNCGNIRIVKSVVIKAE